MKDEQGTRIGVISIPPKAKKPSELPFARFYAALGSNTGNMMFTVAVHAQMKGDLRQVGYLFEPERVNNDFDKIVIPCANWLKQGIDWDWFCDLIEQLEIPVIPVGLGLQCPQTEPDRVSISPSSERLVRLFSQKAEFISVRGDFTNNYLRSIGIKNAVTTGCPSLYFRICDKEAASADGGIAILSTRYPLRQDFLDTKSLNIALFSLAAKHDLDIIFQSEREEMEYLFYENESALFPEQYPDGLQQVYGFDTPEQLVGYIGRRGRCFIDLKEWANYVQTKAAVIGTRLHGTILALNAGCPAVLFAHDSRTAEMITFADLPTAQVPADVGSLDPSGLRALIADDGLHRYLQRRQKNQRVYQEFLAANRLPFHEGAMF